MSIIYLTYAQNEDIIFKYASAYLLRGGSLIFFQDKQCKEEWNMELENFFPIWNQLTADQKNRIQKGLITRMGLSGNIDF